ncbi:ribosome maturation factor RimP [Paenibacillus thermoaerophilus]|uniref:Ribosome maturation factor RimP n=1 Tax=Paenibacillus thermoaerophilus TaxID=1215385 RepID=A0ABW2V0W4_9BACL|nr:ribosome maturation factor RimP [Paenibacillus thermoaerophilus]TMV13834.1 ribosome maturation factor RimP [Paenibacillus thermoaerophilus]
MVLSGQIKAVVEELLQPFLEREKFELVDIEYVKEGSNWFLRVFLDKEGGIDIEDCGRASEYLSKKLDERDPIPDAYFLEVSSPGAERPLKKPADYNRAIGKNVCFTTYEPVDGAKEFEGRLESYDGQTAVIVLHGSNKRQELPVSKVASARLAILF